MKKIVVLFALFLILGANIYWDCIDSTGNLSELQLANIEALASGEELGCGGNPTFIKDNTLKSPYVHLYG